MEPALRPGDRLLVCTWATPHVGDIVVIRDPQFPRTFLVKRVDARSGHAVVVRGDNPNVSRDSRDFGPIHRDLIVGRAVYRYLPGERRGTV
jgi:nickel-type superoxide dismutase maturation protease